LNRSSPANYLFDKTEVSGVIGELSPKLNKNQELEDRVMKVPFGIILPHPIEEVQY
jgi:hypothetical protein